MEGFRPTSLSLDNGNFNVSWMYNTAREELYFEVNAKAEGWVGFGFAFTPENMRNYDVVIGGHTVAGTPYFNVSYLASTLFAKNDHQLALMYSGLISCTVL